MNNSTKRALRTAFHVLLALVAAIPAVIAGLPPLAIGAQVLVVTAVVAKALNALEDAGLIPSWLKEPTVAHRRRKAVVPTKKVRRASK